MSGDIGPNDVVVCVDDSDCTTETGEMVQCPWRRGQIAGRVVSESPCGRGVELDRWHSGYQYVARYRFRKLNDGEDDAELIARIKGRSPVRERTPA